MLAQSIVSRTSSGVGEGIGGVYLYGLVVVLDGPLVLAQVVVRNTTVAVGDGPVTVVVGVRVSPMLPPRWRWVLLPR